MSDKINFILQADSYKFSQFQVYPENTTGQFSYIEARSKKDVIVPFGLQMWIKKNLLDPITQADIDEAEEVATLHGDPFNRAGWEYILNEYDGYMPLTIQGIPEGTITESLTPIVTVMCTDAKVFWLASYIETSLQRGIWYSTSVASNDYQNYKTLKYFYDHSSDNIGMLPYALNDFGSRGVTSEESSQIGGIAHLVFFQGTDNMSGIMAGRKYYNTPCAGGSVPASEHSNACAYGKDDQRTYLKRMLDTYAKPGKVVSIVIDGYDVYREANLLCTEFKQQIIDSGACVTFRPDCYAEGTKILTPDGWIDFSEVTLDTLVAQVKEDNSYEFVNPLKIVNEYYSGEMIHFTDCKEKLDILVTPNHRMVLNHKGNKKIVFAEDCKISSHNYSLYRTASAKSDTTNKLSNLQRLRIAFQADGSYVTKQITAIRFSFSKQRKIDRMTQLLNSMGLEYKIYDLQDDRKEFHIKIDSDRFGKNFSWVDTSKLTKEWCQDFIEELSYWDSCRRSDSRFKFDTTYKQVVDVVELVALSAGYGCLISEYIDDRKEIFNNIFTANILKDGMLGGQSIQKNTVNYNGKIYCVTVPTGKILVKRNRSTLVCGNSGDMFDVVPRLLKMQEDSFGFVINSKGKKVINNVRVIQGDGIDSLTLGMLAQKVNDLGYAPECVIYGSGGGLLQKVNRDTYKFAQKTSAMIINGEWVATVKDPITDPGKKSKGGLLHDSRMITFYKDGSLFVDDSMNDIRKRAMC